MLQPRGLASTALVVASFVAARHVPRVSYGLVGVLIIVIGLGLIRPGANLSTEQAGAA
jgi:hypothetical protein